MTTRHGRQIQFYNEKALQAGVVNQTPLMPVKNPVVKRDRWKIEFGAMLHGNNTSALKLQR